jgi:hypothetical protein
MFAQSSIYNFFIITASILGGLAQSIAFTCASTSIRKLCIMYSEMTKTDPYSSHGFFFGVFGIFIQLGNFNSLNTSVCILIFVF